MIEMIQPISSILRERTIREISIKRSIGKLKLEGPTEDFSRSPSIEHGFRQIGLELHETTRSERLPMLHRDPFDRLLIAQAIEAGAQAVTDDRQWEGCPLKVVF